MESIAYLIISLIFIAVNIVLLILWALTKKHIFGILLGFVWLWYLISDSKTNGSFWTEFHEQEIVSKIKDSDQNKTIIGWRSTQEHFFTKQNIANYASAFEWKLSDSLIGSYDSLKVFLSKFDRLENFAKEIPFVIIKNNVFEQLEPNNDYRIYIFTTNVQAISISFGDVTAKNGFAILSSNGKRLRVFHYWGEI